MKQLSKTDFILYLECAKNVWIKWHKPEEYAKFEISEFEKSLGAMGNDVEEKAREMFPGGYLVEKRSDGAQDLTKKLIALKTPVIFQAVFKTEKYMAATDVMVWNEDANAYDLYEIKMSSTEENDGEGNIKIDKKKERQFEYDITFQAIVVEMCDIKINKKYLVRINRKYVRMGAINVHKLFDRNDKTEIVEKLKSEVYAKMEGACVYLSDKKMPVGPCECYYKGRSSHCTTFTLSNPHVPEYSVHDLNRIGNSKKYLKELLDEGILEIENVPEDDRLRPKEKKEGEEPSKPRKLNQVIAHKTKKPIIDLPAIKRELDSLTFPLYFLDYETYPTAIPPFDGYHPYQHIVFQYSLHVLTEEDAKNNVEPKHFECLILEGDPAENIVKSLRTNIGDVGTIISWNKSFENSRNREMAHLLPSYASFLNDVIKRTYDLKDIVDNQYYIHHGFKGSASIKKVQRVIAPDFSYKLLGVQNGTEAIEAYRQISSGELNSTEAEEKKREMLEYCMYDTKVMYIIWKFFRDLCR